MLESIPSGPLTQRDLERAAWSIARRETNTVSAFAGELIQPRRIVEICLVVVTCILGLMVGIWKGQQRRRLDRTIDELRVQLFLQSLGNFLNPSTFQTVIQPSVIRKALDGRTKFDYLGGRKKEDVILAAQKVALETMKKELGDDIALWGYRPGSMPTAAGSRIQYSNRGTYIQITEMTPEGRFAEYCFARRLEMGEHANDQADLARDWRFKPMVRVRENWLFQRTVNLCAQGSSSGRFFIFKINHCPCPNSPGIEVGSSSAQRVILQ
ncbi:MAG: hypothetical protein R2688_07205 [Fimbriimonadaceae bacterium]